MSNYSRFIGTGSYYPSDVRTNADLEQMVDTSDEWITDRTGIKERRIIGADETAATMGAEASKKAIEMAGIDPKSIDMIVCATTSGRYALPSTACEIQRILDIDGIPAFDVAAACAGYCYALSVADQYIKSGMAKRILVVGTDCLSRLINLKTEPWLSCSAMRQAQRLLKQVMNLAFFPHISTLRALMAICCTWVIQPVVTSSRFTRTGV